MSVNFLFVGDIMAGENFYHFGRGIKTVYKQEYKDFIHFDVSKILFENIDFFVSNFEYSLVKDDECLSSIDNSVYTAKAETLKLFEGKHVNIVNVANNHFAQHGNKRVQTSIDILNQNNFVIIGLKHAPVILSSKSKRIFLWGVSLIADSDDTGLFFKCTYHNLLNKIELPLTKNLMIYG
jgi:hypothetical protein